MTGIYQDYMGLQYIPQIFDNAKVGEPVKWRQDGKCGPGYTNSLGTEAMCKDPHS